MQVEDIIRLQVNNEISDILPKLVKNEVCHLADDKTGEEEIKVDMIRGELEATSKEIEKKIDRNIGKLSTLYNRNYLDRCDIDDIGNSLKQHKKETDESIIHIKTRLADMSKRPFTHNLMSLERIDQKMKGLSAGQGILSDRLTQVGDRLTKIENRILNIDLEGLVRHESEVQAKQIFSKLLEGMFNLKEEDA